MNQIPSKIMLQVPTVLHYLAIIGYAATAGLIADTDLAAQAGIPTGILSIVLHLLGERIGRANTKAAAEALPEPQKSPNGQVVSRLKQLLTLAISEAYSQGNTALVTHLNTAPTKPATEIQP